MKPKPKAKTWGREVTGVGLLAWALVTMYVFLWLPVEAVDTYSGMYNNMTVTLWGAFIAMAVRKGAQTLIENKYEGQNVINDYGDD